MIRMTFQAAKQGFFDRAKVKNAADAGTRRVLSRFGAFVRTRAKTSIRKKKGTSPPGSPPQVQRTSVALGTHAHPTVAVPY